jgi:hypothetical protein
MLIEGPFKLGVVETPHAMGHELPLSFRDQFRANPIADQALEVRRYIAELHATAAQLPPKDNNRHGMLTIAQVAEQLLPHLEQDEIPEEPIVIELRSDLAAGFPTLNGPASY